MAGSQIASICRNATMAAISEAIDSSKKKAPHSFLIKARHFEEAVRKAQMKEEPVHAESR
jgi:SpoVK/Ycf46/Vps4 family AAA+-type ATPase